MFESFKNKINIILGAFQISILLFPANILNDMISWNIESIWICLYMIPLVCGFLICTITVSENIKQAIIKIGVAVPLTLLWRLYLIHTDFHYRLVKRVFHEYDALAHGEKLLGFLIIVVTLFVVLIAFATGIFLSHKKISDNVNKILFFIKNIVSPIVCTLIFFMILYLECNMPPYIPVYG